MSSVSAGTEAASFRLLTEPASLKPAPGRHDGPARTAFPAPHRAGLIEAIILQPSSRASPGLFPAPHRAGLIEACSTPGAAGRRDEFPAPHRAGLIEACRCRLAIRSRTGFPAPHRAGLIEAAAPTSSSRCSSCFRLLTEPASLKHVVTIVLFDPFARFRLLTEPASLKPTQCPPHARPQAVSGSSQSRPH